MKNNADRPIDRRFVPPTKGIDLEQALNYLDLQAAGEEFIYEHYTCCRVLYVPGARPRLEAAAAAAGGTGSQLEVARALSRWVAANVKWAGYYQQATGQRLPADRAPTEEQLLDAGYGWCNEQARLFCALAQVRGLPARLVFAANQARRYGHVVAEVLLDTGWLLVDQSLGFVFDFEGAPVRASQVFHDPRTRVRFAPVYKRLCKELLSELGPGSEADFAMAAAEEPLDGFTDLGYHNYFIHN